jgi:hypothetical protein
MISDKSLRDELKKLGRIIIVSRERTERLNKICGRANAQREKNGKGRVPLAMQRKVAQAFTLKNNIDEKIRKQYLVLADISINLVLEAKRKRK